MTIFGSTIVWQISLKGFEAYGFLVAHLKPTNNCLGQIILARNAVFIIKNGGN
jgi:hypothetical protein